MCKNTSRIQLNERRTQEAKIRCSNRLCKSLLDPKPFTLTSLYVYNPETSKNSFKQKPRAETMFEVNAVVYSMVYYGKDI